MCSGKSTISEKILQKFPNLNFVNSDNFRAYFRNSFPYFQDLDESYETQKWSQASKVADIVREYFLELFMQESEMILLNKSWLNYEDRKRFLDMVPSEKYTKILVQTRISYEQLEKRILLRDSDGSRGNNWYKFQKEKREKLYEPVSDREAEYVLTYDQNNLAEILAFLEKQIN